MNRGNKYLRATKDKLKGTTPELTRQIFIAEANKFAQPTYIITSKKMKKLVEKFLHLVEFKEDE